LELIRLEEITKLFPGVRALDNVSLHVNSGEILALVGENGAGKSTLMKVLSGTYPAGSFSGNIFVDGQKVEFHSPRDAESAGIAIIHQELSSFLHLSVAENLFVGHWPSSWGLVNWPQLYAEAQKWLSLVGVTCKPEDRMADLSVGTQQMVEIAKALSRNTRVLILDEPTSALTAWEVELLYALLKKLRAQGKGLVYISHKMEEIYQLSDRITVLRDGQSVHTANTKELPSEELLSKMVGRPLNRLFPPSPSREFGAEMLRVENFIGHSAEGKRLFGPISFTLYAGEILGFAGLLGAGRSELMQAIFGDEEIETSGSLWLKGKKVDLRSPRLALREHLVFVPEDRKRDSILPQRSLNENVAISRLAARNIFQVLNETKEEIFAQTSLRSLDVKATDSSQLIQELSGGNQQKVILGRGLQTSPSMILLDEPTRGVDVGAKYDIYEIIFSLALEGRAVLLISSDLLELIALADRILVLNGGLSVRELNREHFSQTEIMKYAISQGVKLSF